LTNVLFDEFIIDLLLVDIKLCDNDERAWIREYNIAFVKHLINENNFIALEK